MVRNMNTVSQYSALMFVRNSMLQVNRNNAKATKFGNLSTVSKKDTVSISSQALNRGNQVSAISALTSINGKPIKDLKATNNVLTLNAGEYYSIQLDNGQNMVVSSGSNRTINAPYEDLVEALGIGMNDIAPETASAYDKMNRFLTALCDFSTYGLCTQFTAKERTDYFNRLGIEFPGWVEINNRGRVNRFYLEKDGSPWPEEQIENARAHFAEYDFRKDGCTADSVLIVNGKEYKMDENGHFNIPKGEPVVYSNGLVVFPKEIREYLLTQTAASHG